MKSVPPITPETLPPSRRQMLRLAGTGFGMLGLASILADDAAAATDRAANPLAAQQPHHPPRAKRGTCAQCGLTLTPPKPSFGAAPIPFDNVFVHHNCLCQFALSRWEGARLALHRLGINSA